MGGINEDNKPFSKERARLIVEKEWTIENAAYYFCNVKNKILYGIHDSTEPSTQYVEIQPTIEGLINEMIKFFQTKSLENATPLQRCIYNVAD